MSTPAPGRKLSTADLATPAARTEEERRQDAQLKTPPDTLKDVPPETRTETRTEARPEALTNTPRPAPVDVDDAGMPMPPPQPVGRAEMRTGTPPQTPQNRATDDEEVSELFADAECHALWKRWDDIQAGFVDEPRRAVQDADSLVAETMQQLANTFARERGNLEQQWGRGDNVSTEDLRIAFRRYRSFFKRLLSV
jgi:hypothetical protein